MIYGSFRSERRLPVCEHGSTMDGMRIEGKALVGHTRAAALVGRDGSMDWVYRPDFDSPACGAGLLGDDSHGRWLMCCT